MKLVVGLGNPGDQYKKTRHNAGFMAVDELVKAFSFSEFKKSDKFKAYIVEGQIGNEKVILAKPQTYMNLSGQSVQALQNFYKLDVSDIIIIYDDVELPIGTLRIRPWGSAGGHNGMKSVTQELSTMEVPRIRIGIKPEASFPGALEDFVLGKLTDEEMKWLEKLFSDLSGIVEKLVQGKIEEVMNEYN